MQTKSNSLKRSCANERVVAPLVKAHSETGRESQRGRESAACARLRHSIHWVGHAFSGEFHFEVALCVAAHTRLLGLVADRKVVQDGGDERR